MACQIKFTHSFVSNWEFNGQHKHCKAKDKRAVLEHDKFLFSNRFLHLNSHLNSLSLEPLRCYNNISILFYVT